MYGAYAEHFSCVIHCYVLLDKEAEENKKVPLTHSVNDTVKTKKTVIIAMDNCETYVFIISDE